jgi:hypothetical protein
MQWLLKFNFKQQKEMMKIKKKFVFGKKYNKILIGQIMKHLIELMKDIRKTYRSQINKFQKMILHKLLLKA